MLKRKLAAIWAILTTKRFFLAYEKKKDAMFSCYSDIKLWQLQLISKYIDGIVDETLSEESAINEAKNIINGID